MKAAERFGAPHQIRLAELSVFNLPPRPGLMAILKGYMDDSLQDHVWSVGGYVADDGRWQRYSGLWSDMLKRHKVPYPHMKEMGKKNGVYSHWQPRQQHKLEIDAFFQDAIGVIRECNLTGVCSIIRKNDLDRFNKDFVLNLEPYPLAAYGCLIAISWMFPEITVEIWFDHCDRIKRKLRTAERYILTDGYFGKLVDKNIIYAPLLEKLTFREITEMQCADHLAWEFRKDHFKIQDWFSLVGKPDDLLDRQQHFIEWSAKSNVDPWRKSLGALMAEGKIFGTTWDYEGLATENTARGGVWSTS